MDRSNVALVTLAQRSRDDGALRQRVARFARIWTMVAALGVALRAGVALLMGDRAELTQPSLAFHTAAVLAGSLLWVVPATLRLSKRSLGLFEAATMLIGSALIGFTGRSMAAELSGGGMVHQYAGLVAVFVLAAMLVLRAALVPSTTRRVVSLGGGMGVTILLVLEYESMESLARGELTGSFLSVLAPWLVTIALSGAVASVIHGLREEVREARQLGPFTLEEELGSGGMGVVHRARHAMLRRPTAVKLLRGRHRDAAAIERFEREVQLTAELNHPGIVTVFDYGRTADGTLYYAMELLEGATVEEVVEVGGPMAVPRVVRVLAALCDALGAAHEFGLVHRDIKPANIMLAKQGSRHDVAKVLDFGLASVAGEASSDVAGTPLYLAPESIHGTDEVDARADLYALGAVAYFMLTGRPLFEGDSIMDICVQQVMSRPLPPSIHRSGVAPALERLILACLAKSPSERPCSAAALRKELLALSVGWWTDDDASAWWDEHARALEMVRRRRRQGAHARSADHLENHPATPPGTLRATPRPC